MTIERRTIEPYLLELSPGEYQWCGCGRAAGGLCDGAGVYSCAPVRFTVKPRKGTQTVWLCRCLQTRTPPFCDGSHNKVPAAPQLRD